MDQLKYPIGTFPNRLKRTKGNWKMDRGSEASAGSPEKRGGGTK
ncbi:hypothetical protein PO124_17200 [Bacillus licheniformis]|nr:hypothetical protein [Bacillus licheniformis]